MKTIIKLTIFLMSCYLISAQTTQTDVFPSGGGWGSNVSYTNFGTFGQAFNSVVQSSNNINREGFIYAQDRPATTVYVSEDYTSANSIWGFDYFNNLTTALGLAAHNATVNITNYSHSGNVDMTGRTFVVGALDFDVTGNLSGGLVQVTSTGKLLMNDLASNTTKSFPITDGTHNYTMTITTADVNNPDISVRISNLNPTGSINSDFWDIDGPLNLNATVTLRVDKASIAPKTLSTNSQLRYFDGTKYTPVNGNNFSIQEFDTYYIITLTGVNKF